MLDPAQQHRRAARFVQQKAHERRCLGKDCRTCLLLSAIGAATRLVPHPLDTQTTPAGTASLNHMCHVHAHKRAHEQGAGASAALSGSRRKPAVSSDHRVEQATAVSASATMSNSAVGSAVVGELLCRMPWSLSLPSSPPLLAASFFSGSQGLRSPFT